MSSPTPPPPPYLPPPPPAPVAPAHRRARRRLVAAGAAGAVLLVGTGAATTAVALEVLDRDSSPGAGTSLVPSTTSQEDTGTLPDAGRLPQLTPYGGSDGAFPGTGPDGGSGTRGATDASA